MVNFLRNNLDKATSPYLLQHKDNPIYWQEWSYETTEYAEEQSKPLFVSVGYATCHWCHVMAHEAFEDKGVAAFLNENFVSIKVDREQRPDIDQYLMSFLVQSQGGGGWPLNVILTPDLKPFFAATYIPLHPSHGFPGFLSVLESAKDHYSKNKENISEYHLPRPQSNKVDEDKIINSFLEHFDSEYGGFGYGLKFPPHNSLLFLIFFYEKTKDKRIGSILEKTLDRIAFRGLCDYLQGGFYRYCVDREWQIPHFEKMLYDQAMLLWAYSSAYKVFKNDSYKTVAEGIISCLIETFESDGLFYSAHDADTDHEEGKTYLWSKEELENVLGSDGFSDFSRVYSLYLFEGRYHLLKKQNKFLPEIEEKLLLERKKREQPFVDRKIVTSWNCLAGIGLIHAFRFLGDKTFLFRAQKVFIELSKKHFIGGVVFHSSLDGEVQQNEFLEDVASLLLFATYIYEETGEHLETIRLLFSRMQKFYDNCLYEGFSKDFIRVPAKDFDHPTPSSVSLFELASVRTKIILGEEYDKGDYLQPLEHDFYNLATAVRNGEFHIIHTPSKIQWDKLSINSIQIRDSGFQDCFDGKCTLFENVEELIDSLRTS
ncbi:thioredoxin domain-containing protein [Candidatus Woesearchaeota archaeon]|nr:thioredoxin domain-containing protein [Candidatus Woesearchaeota archaeon]